MAPPRDDPREALLRWRCARWEELSIAELYALLALRQEVFVVEQDCPYQDADGRDAQAFHVWAELAAPFASLPEGAVVACARCFGPGVRYREASLGRVVSSLAVRRTGVGRALVARCLEELERRFGPVPVRISAQQYLERFYGGYGFVTEGAPYLEDDIPHVAMVRPWSAGQVGSEP